MTPGQNGNQNRARLPTIEEPSLSDTLEELGSSAGDGSFKFLPSQPSPAESWPTSEDDTESVPSENGQNSFSQHATLLNSRELDGSSEVGSRCEVQVLYEGPFKCDCCINWVEEYPDDLREPVEEQADVKMKALIVRKRKNHDEGRPLVLDSVVIQNASLKKTLGEVFEGYDGITTDLKNLVFKAPFTPFHYRWKRFEQIMERQKHDQSSALPFTQLFFRVLDAEFHDTMAEISDLVQHGVITFSLLWAIFEPGKLIVAREEGVEQFLIVNDCSYHNRIFEEGFIRMSAKYVDWDGERFGYASKSFEILTFSGTRRISELDVFPAEFHPTKDEARSMAISRGKRFETLREHHYMAHSGVVQYTAEEREVKRNVDGRIVVDAASYFRVNPSEQVQLASLSPAARAPQISTTVNGAFPSSLAGKTETGQGLTDEQLLLCNTHVRGYSLVLKIWVELKVQDVHDIAWDDFDAAYPNLMLPEGFKTLVLSCVEGQLASDNAFDDIIEGKGLGVIILLAGKPGTGKTLTAEAMADKIRKPLYVLSAGQLGQDSSTVEKNLRDVLALTERWGSVLLLDECDVFIQQRSTSDLAYNEIVAVFLRMLEYYRGILLMTSNRADTIDSAFHSRIHLTLHYPELEPAARRHIWRRISTQSNTSNKITNDQFEFLARLPLNGRQIKNVVKAASLLAVHENTQLGMEHIRTVLQATGEVDQSLLDDSRRRVGTHGSPLLLFLVILLLVLILLPLLCYLPSFQYIASLYGSRACLKLQEFCRSRVGKRLY